MIGYVVEFCKLHAIAFDIYANYGDMYDGMEPFASHSKGWYEFYTMIFGCIPWIPTTEYSAHADLYDITFLLTDTDYNFSRGLCNRKVICIDHDFVHHIKDIGVYIGVRPLPCNPQHDWAIPCYRIIPSSDVKLNIIPKNKVHVGFLGAPNIPISCDFIRSTFDRAEDIEFHVIARVVNTDYSGMSNMHVYQDISAVVMINLLAQCHYVFCYDYHPHYQTNKTSGSISMAFNLGCRLILPSTWAQHYTFMSPIVYDNTTLPLQLTVQNALDHIETVFGEREQLINKRDTVFKNAIQATSGLTYTVLA